MAAPDAINIAVIASAVCGSVVIIVAIVLTICLIGYCRERLRRAPDRDGAAETNRDRHHHHHHRRRRRRRHDIADQREEGEGVEDIHLEDSELQRHPEPPPAYSTVHQYSSIETDLNIDIRENSEETGTAPATVSMFIGDEEIVERQDSTTSEQEIIVEVGPPQAPTELDTLPPTYSMALVAARSAGVEQGGSDSILEEDSVTSQNRSRRGSLPPSYSTARLELMKRRAQSMDQVSDNNT